MPLSRRSLNKTEQNHLQNIGREKFDIEFIAYTINQIRQKLRISKRKTKKPLIIALIGLVGSGKSSVAKELKKNISAVILSTNFIRARYLRPYHREYHLYTEPILQELVTYILEKGGNVILDRDDVDGKTKKIFERAIRKSKARVVHIRVVADRDVMMKRLIEAKYDPKNNIIIDRIVALREMWRRTPLHYDWIKNPWSRFVLKKKLPIRPMAMIDTTDGNAWKKEVKEVIQRLKKQTQK